MNTPANSIALRVDHPGAIDLKILGHELIEMLRHAGGGHRVPPWLKVDESGAQRSYVGCPICGARANSGKFALSHAYRPGTLTLPYLAVHLLAAHGTLALPRVPVEADVLTRLRAFLNVDEQELARLLVGHVAMAAPIPHVGVLEEPVKGIVQCAACGDELNMGQVTFTHAGGASVALPYLALHALLEHRDARYAGGGLKGQVDLDAVHDVLAATDLVALGKRLAGLLEFLGGDDDPPEGLVVEEHPLRGLEQCTQCDTRPNMGTFSLLHQGLGLSMVLPYVAVHALVEHGSAHYRGSLHEGRVDVPTLRRMLGAA